MKKRRRSSAYPKIKNTGAKKPWIKKGLTGGLLFAIILLVLSLLSKYLLIFNGFTNFFMDLFSEFGYDLNLFGLILGTIYAFITGYILFCLYTWIFEKLKL